MIRYYCSGLDLNNSFGYGLGKMLKKELKNTKSIVYIPGGFEKIEKSKVKYIPMYTEHFKKIGLEFDEINLITPSLSIEEMKKLIDKADFLMLMGGNPFSQKKLCEELNILSNIKEFKGIIMGISAGAMFMSKYIIVTPCSEEYPEFHIEEGLNFDELSIYPHNNTSNEIYPDELIASDEIYKKQDLISVAKEYGKFYLLQDNLREDGKTDVSIIKSVYGKVEFYIENDGKIWEVNDDIKLL